MRSAVPLLPLPPARHRAVSVAGRRSADGSLCPGGLLRPIRDAPALLEEARDREDRIAELEARLADALRRLESYKEKHEANPSPGVSGWESGAQEHSISPDGGPNVGGPRTEPDPSPAQQEEVQPAPLDGSTSSAQPDTLVAEDGQLTLGDEPGTSSFFGSAGSHYLWVRSCTQGE